MYTWVCCAHLLSCASFDMLVPFLNDTRKKDKRWPLVIIRLHETTRLTVNQLERHKRKKMSEYVRSRVAVVVKSGGVKLLLNVDLVLFLASPLLTLFCLQMLLLLKGLVIKRCLIVGLVIPVLLALISRLVTRMR